MAAHDVYVSDQVIDEFFFVVESTTVAGCR